LNKLGYGSAHYNELQHFDLVNGVFVTLPFNTKSVVCCGEPNEPPLSTIDEVEKGLGRLGSTGFLTLVTSLILFHGQIR
jgi:hypothetical protein